MARPNINSATGLHRGPDAPGIRFLGDLQRLEVKPGDRFVLTTNEVFTKEACDRIQEVWREYIGSGEARAAPLLILEPGMKLGAIGTDKESST